MISKEVEGLFLDEECGDLIIRSEDVASVNCNNNLYHAFLVLSKVKYSSIPVIDNQSHIRGIISMPMIINAITDIDSIRIEDMEKIKVEQVMQTEVATVRPDTELEDMLNGMLNHNFLCVADVEGTFLGIITRKAILVRVNHLVHQLHRRYELSAKEPALADAGEIS